MGYFSPRATFSPIRHFQMSLFSIFSRTPFSTRDPGTKTEVSPLLHFRSFHFLHSDVQTFRLLLLLLLLLCFRITACSVFLLKTMRFQISPFSNRSTLNSVFKCPRFQSFQMETATQKLRHSTPF